MTTAYKKIVITNEFTQGMYIFVGGLKKEFDTAYKRDPSDKKFNQVISRNDKQIIKNIGGDVYFVEDIIHNDDTISNIKKKIIAGTGLPIVYDEVYLFSKNNYTISNNQMLYRVLSNNGKRDISYETIEKLLLNLDGMDKVVVPDIPTFGYNDIVELDISGQHTAFTSLGMNIDHKNVNTLYVTDPYLVDGIDKYVAQYYNDIAVLSESSLLMDYPPPLDDVIYVRTVTDVVNVLNKQGIPSEIAIGIYFPLLYKQNITSIDLFDSNRETLLDKTREMIRDVAWTNNNKIVDTMYDIYNKDSSKVHYIKRGISRISVSVGDGVDYNLPIENIFKTITSSFECPIVKYNPGKVHENIYRLFSDKKTSTGEKIPLMSKSNILKLVKKIGLTPKSISMYCDIRLDGSETPYDVFIDITISGTIIVSIEFETPVTFEIIDDIIGTAYVTIITKIRNYLEIIGYNIPEFNGISSEPTKIRSMTYEVLVPHKKTFDIKNVTKCMSAVFGATSTGKKSTLRFKRVSNYNDMSAHTAYIIEMVNDRAKPQDIIRGLVDEFRLKEDVATEKVTTFLSNIEITTDMFSGNKPIIYNSPGLPVNVTRESMSTTLKISVSDIPSINYIDTLDVYLDSFIRIAEKPSIVPSSLCVTRRLKVVAPIEDIIVDRAQPVALDEYVPDKNKLSSDVPDDKQTDLMSFLMGMDDGDDDDDEDDDDEDDDDDGKGVYSDVNAGGISDEERVSDTDDDEVVPDVSGTRLNNPNPISARLYKREPKLFMKKDGVGFSSYSRMCPSSLRRQPIILTDSEKKYIDKHHPGSYNQSIKYKTSGDSETHHYICPRYWSLRDNVSLTEKEVKEKHAGEIIGSNDKVIKPGQHIYEFDKTYHRDKNGKYAGTYPGFMTLDSHVDGMCIPCCFKQWDGVRQRELRGSCESAIGPPKDNLILLDNKVGGDMYIIGPEGFPITRGRYGYLPLPIQRFLNIDSKMCQVSETDTLLKPDTECLVRTGVELHKTQSFIGALASVYNKDDGNFETIVEMKDIIKASMSLDSYITLQNGTLVDTFHTDKNGKPDVNKYADTRIFMRLKGTDMEHILERYISSYENFIEFLDDPEVVLDYTYLWDIVCMPNRKLFEHGINLIILEITDDDSSDNVSIICPPTQYNSKFGDPTRKHAILIKRDNYYEHVISLKHGAKIEIRRTFSTLYKWLIPTIQQAIMFIKKNINMKCRPNESLPKTYTFSQGVSLETCLTTLLRHKYTIRNQVMNYNGKIVGLIVEKNGNVGYLPCLPSGVLPILETQPAPGLPVSGEVVDGDPIDIMWIEEFKGYPYKETRDFLIALDKKTNGVLKCNPRMKVNNDGLLVAIITETNQLIPVQPSEDIHPNDIETAQDNDMLTIDRDISRTLTPEESHVTEFTNNVHLEGELYTTFRATIKRAIHSDTNRHILRHLEDVIESSDSYKSKMETVIDLLKGVSKKYVRFLKRYVTKDMLGNVTMCMGKHRGTTGSCEKGVSGVYLKLPSENLINQADNIQLYHARLSDEIIRYMDMRNYMLQFDKIIAPQNIKYKINNDEILIYQSSLTKAYFDALNGSNINPYIYNKTWETSMPQNEPVYDNKVDIVYKPQICNNPTGSILNTKLSGIIPNNKDFEELTYDNKPECSFELLRYICSISGDPNIEDLTIPDIKNALVEEYKKYSTEYIYSILGLLEENDKQLYSKKIQGGEITFDDLINQEDYLLTHLDIWIFSNKYEIPMIILWDGIFVETTSNIIVTKNSPTGDYFFIRMKGYDYDPTRPHNAYEKSYKLLRRKTGRDTYEYRISNKYIGDGHRTLIDDKSKDSTLETILASFNRDVMRKKKREKLDEINGKTIIIKKGPRRTIKK